MFLFKKTTLFVLLTGLLSFLIHPTVINGVSLPQLDFLAWVYLVPLILALHQDVSFKRRIVFSLGAGVVGHYGLLFWLVTAMKNFGGLNVLEAFGVLTALVLVLSLIFAFLFSLSLWVCDKTRLPLAVVLPVFMLVRDMVVHYFPFGGYPWGLPPYSQGSWIGAFQWIDATGVEGLSFFIYLINGLGADASLGWLKARTFNKQVFIKISAILILFVCSFFLSQRSLYYYEQSKTALQKIKVALIQGNVTQDVKWNPAKAQQLIKAHVELTRKALQSYPDLVVWPETAYPYAFRLNELATTKFFNMTAPIFFGAITLREDQNNKKEIFNSILYANQTGDILGFYQKIHLVPFGEYLPFRKYFSFMESLTQGVGFLTPGQHYTLFEVEGIKFGSLICIEDVFPSYARKFTQEGAHVLINYTNDAWYGKHSTQFQHVVYSQFRALENRRYLLRATNTGKTAVISPKGEVIDAFSSFQEGYLLHHFLVESGDSVYTKYGNQWIIAVYSLAGLLFVWALFFRRRASVIV